jgi:hypothetical protein
MTKFYLVIVYGDVEPMTAGPYKSSIDRDQGAKDFRASDEAQEDGIFWLNITDDWAPEIGAYSDSFFEESAT